MRLNGFGSCGPLARRRGSRRRLKRVANDLQHLVARAVLDHL